MQRAVDPEELATRLLVGRTADLTKQVGDGRLFTGLRLPGHAEHVTQGLLQTVIDNRLCFRQPGVAKPAPPAGDWIMRTFSYERPGTLAEALAMLGSNGGDARPLAGGTDLIIRLRDGTLRPEVVVDVKRIPELRPGIRDASGWLTIGATTSMTEIAADERIRDRFIALAEAAAVVGSVQIRNRATLGGNICNASPAADTAPPLLVYGAEVVVAGPARTRRLPLADFFVRSGVTGLGDGELLVSIDLPIPTGRTGSVQLRRTRRRGHDLAAVTMSCLVDDAGLTKVAYGSVGPRPVVFTDQTGTLADPAAADDAKAAILDGMFAGASPSPSSMRASPGYRSAMLRVLGRRALAIALERRALA
jgi:carbon-monoxide dehydrogenase medium subunit